MTSPNSLRSGDRKNPACAKEFVSIPPCVNELGKRRAGFVRRHISTFSMLSVVVLMVSCGSPGSRPLANQSVPPARVTVTAGDVLKIVFSGNADLNTTQKIRGDGKISLPQVGEVTAAGKTLAQIQAEVSSLYQPVLRNTDVLVMLESAVTRVFMAGAVAKPGPLTLDRPTTIIQAIMQAGGPNQFGNMRKVQVIRLVNGQEQSQILDLRPTLQGRTTHPFYVHDGDVISIAQSAF
jgi:polysaccharide export outer membrane protein